MFTVQSGERALLSCCASWTLAYGRAVHRPRALRPKTLHSFRLQFLSACARFEKTAVVATATRTTSHKPYALPASDAGTPLYSPDLTRPPPGFCGLPGVTSPAHFREYWRCSARPRLDALLRAASLEPPGAKFLGLMDRLLAELRNVLAPAQHAEAHHADAAWREAGRDVADACGKYETFIFQAADTELLPKLELTQRRLTAQLRSLTEQPRLTGEAQGQEQEQGQGQGQGQRMERHVQSEVVPQARIQRHGRSEQRQREGGGEEGSSECQTEAGLLRLRRLVRLSWLLRRSLLRGGAGLEDEGDGEGELSRLYAVRVAPSGAQERLSRLLAAERQAVAAVEAAVAAGPAPLALPLEELRAALLAPEPTGPVYGIGTGARACEADAGDGGGDGDGAAGHRRGASEVVAPTAAPAAAAVAAAGGGGGAANDGLLRADPFLGPMLATAAAAGVPLAAVGLPLTPANLRALLRGHPSAAVRRAAYERGLLPRLGAALARLGAVAAVRGEVAALLGYSCFAEYSYSRSGLAVADAGAVLGLLQALAEALGPMAQLEVQQLREALAEDRTARRAAATTTTRTCATTPTRTCGRAPGLQPTGGLGDKDCDGRVGSGGGSGGGGGGGCSSRGGGGGGTNGVRERPAVGGDGGGVSALPELEPWDVEYAQALLMRRRQLPPDPSELTDYMDLEILLSGISELLYDMMGVRLEATVLAPLDADAGGGDGGGGGGGGGGSGRGPCGLGCAPAEVWDARVIRVVVRSDERMIGVVYLDPGSGYGTRQLRFPTGGAPAAEAAAEATTDGGGGRAGGDGASGGSGALPYGYDSVPVVAVGLQWEWRGGTAGSPSALHELLHELGHALHLTLSASPSSAPHCQARTRRQTDPQHLSPQPQPPAQPPFAHFGGLQLPRDVMEVPSSLLQTWAYDTAALARICRRRSSRRRQRRHEPGGGGGGGGGEGGPGAGSAAVQRPVAGSWEAAAAAETATEEPDEDQERREGRECRAEEKEEEVLEPMPAELCGRVAAFLAGENAGALTILHKVLASLVDQLLHSEHGPGPGPRPGPGPGEGSGFRSREGAGSMSGGADAAALWQAVKEAYGALPSCPATLRELAALPALAHHQATFHCYLIGLMAASALRVAQPPVVPSPCRTPAAPPYHTSDRPPMALPIDRQVEAAPATAAVAATAAPAAGAPAASVATAPPAVPMPTWPPSAPVTRSPLLAAAASGVDRGAVLATELAATAPMVGAEAEAECGRPWLALRRAVFEAGGAEDAGELLERWLLPLPLSPLGAAAVPEQWMAAAPATTAAAAAVAVAGATTSPASVLAGTPPQQSVEGTGGSGGSRPHVEGVVPRRPPAGDGDGGDDCDGDGDGAALSSWGVSGAEQGSMSLAGRQPYSGGVTYDLPRGSGCRTPAGPGSEVVGDGSGERGESSGSDVKGTYWGPQAHGGLLAAAPLLATLAGVAAEVVGAGREEGEAP